MATRSITRLRGPRRARQWGITSATTSLISTAEAARVRINLSTSLETDLGVRLNNVTASALRLQITATFQATAIVGDQAAFMYGVGWFTDNASSVGPTVLPDPVADNWDWMAHGGVSLVADVAAVISMPRFGSFLLENDSMRKQRENNSGLSILFSGITIDDPITIRVQGRTLFILP